MNRARGRLLGLPPGVVGGGSVDGAGIPGIQLAAEVGIAERPPPGLPVGSGGAGKGRQGEDSAQKIAECAHGRAHYAGTGPPPQAKRPGANAFGICPRPLAGHDPPVITLGILGSGSGSNMQAIQDAIADGRLKARIALVLSDNPEGYILERAREAGIPSQVIDCRGFASKFPEEAQEETAAALKEAGVELVCLAGFMRLVKQPLLAAFPDRILNIHPALLPAYPGLEAWTQAVEDGATESGCTVHYVDAGMDTGPIIAQAKVPVLPDDTPQSLHKRIQVEEHRLYPEAIMAVAGKLGL